MLAGNFQHAAKSKERVKNILSLGAGTKPIVDQGTEFVFDSMAALSSPCAQSTGKRSSIGLTSFAHSVSKEDADVLISLGRISLSENHAILPDQIAERSVKWPEQRVVLRKGRHDDLAPSRDCGLANLVAAQGPE